MQVSEGNLRQAAETCHQALQVVAQRENRGEAAPLAIGMVYAGLSLIWLLMIFASLAYLLGVQLPTVAINVPLNNKLQTLDVASMNEAAQKAARRDFEPRWNRWNSIRAAFASLASALLIILLFAL